MHGKLDLERTRPLTNVEDAVKKLTWVYDNPDEAKKIANRAYQWVSRLTWKSVAEKWDKIFQQTYAELQNERNNPEKTIQKWLAKAPPPSRPHPQTAHLQDEQR